MPDTISPRLEEEFPLDLLLQWRTANRKKTGMSPSNNTRLKRSNDASIEEVVDVKKTREHKRMWLVKNIISHTPLPSDWTSR